MGTGARCKLTRFPDGIVLRNFLISGYLERESEKYSPVAHFISRAKSSFIVRTNTQENACCDLCSVMTVV